MNRFTKEQRAAIVAAYLTGERVKVTAHRHGCCESYVSLLVRRAGHKLRRNHVVIAGGQLAKERDRDAAHFVLNIPDKWLAE